MTAAQYHYTHDYQLKLVTEWRNEMWAHYQETDHEENPKLWEWYYRNWQTLQSLEIGLIRLIEAGGEVEVQS